MPGSWNANALPTRSGAYFDFKAQPVVIIPPSVGAIVAVPFTHSWGPSETPTLLNSMSEFTAAFGNDIDQPGYRAVRQAFVGEGVRGRRGAGAVIAYRMSGSAAAKATVTLQNTTPAAALRVDGLYEGTLGNGLRVTVRTNSIDGTKRDFVVINGATEVEVFTYDPTVANPLAALAAAVNGISKWVRLTVLIDNVALTAVTSVALTGGNNGATLVAGDWTAAMASLETQRFGYLAPFDLTDASIETSMKAWAQNLNAKGRRFFATFGGALNEDAATANTRSGTFNDPDIVNFGVGSVQDNNMVDSAGNPVILSPAQFVPRLAGIMSALGETRSMSGARVGGVELLNGATETGIDSAFTAGTVVLSVDEDPEAPVHIEKGLTTYTLKTDADRPYLIFRNPKYVRTMHSLQSEISEWFASTVLGEGLTVNSQTRSGMIADVSTRLQARQDGGAIQSDWSVEVAADPPPSDDDEFIALNLALAFGRSLEQLLLAIIVR